MKVCSKCKIEKDESEFSKDLSVKNGFKSRCKNCLKINRKPQKINLSYQKQYYENNKIKKLEQAKLRYLEIIKDRDVKIKFDKSKYQKSYKINRNNKDKDFKLKNQLGCLFRKGMSRNGLKKKHVFYNYTGIAYADYITYFENNFPIEFSQITVKGKYHIDHIIPCAVYDFNNNEHIKLCWQPENLRIIPAKENLEKNDKLDFDLIKKHNIEHLLPKDKRRLKCQKKLQFPKSK